MPSLLVIPCWLGSCHAQRLSDAPGGKWSGPGSLAREPRCAPHKLPTLNRELPTVPHPPPIRRGTRERRSSRGSVRLARRYRLVAQSHKRAGPWRAASLLQLAEMLPKESTTGRAFRTEAAHQAVPALPPEVRRPRAMVAISGRGWRQYLVRGRNPDR